MNTIYKIILGILCLFVSAGLFLGTLKIIASRSGSHMEAKVETEDVSMTVSKARRLHKFHGTNYAYYKKGKWWFERNGKRCELWDPRERRK